MKTLLLSRHGKSNWDNPQLQDFNRPLNPSGFKDAARMGKLLKEKEPQLDAFISSPAVRAITTAKLIAKETGYPEKYIIQDERIYMASNKDLLKIINQLEDQHNHVVLFGHNPGLTDIVYYLTDHYIPNIPTCGLVKINFLVSSWGEISNGTGNFVYAEYPKNLLAQK